MPALLLRCVLLLLGLAACADAAGEIRVTSPNGRKVLEIRAAAQPNTGLLRTVVITAGPIAQTTSLMVNTAFVRDIFGPSPPPMTWMVLVSSGTLFSLGGGCVRGNQVDFPYINNNKLAIARFVGTTSTIITATINSAANYESVNCTVSPDRQSTLYVLVNSTAQRTEIWRQNSNNVFTLERQFTLAARLPFNGGLRPSISRTLRSTLPRSGAKGMPLPVPELDYYEADKYMVIDQIASSTIRVQRWEPQTNTLALISSIAGNPASVAPNEAQILSDCAVGDFNQNWVVDAHAVGINHCGLVTNPTPAGSGGGQNGYGYTASAAYFAPRTDRLYVYNSSYTIAGDFQAPLTGASDHAGTDGPFAGCFLAPGTRLDGAYLSVGAQPADPNSLRYAYREIISFLSIFRSGFEQGFAADDELNTTNCEDFNLYEYR
jgi:hypothetical protein